MAKKKTKTIKLQPISIEKYIKERARNLPIEHCVEFSSPGMGINSYIITRRKASGSLLAGVYLVDLFCLGLKDSFYNEFETDEEFESLMDFQKAQMPVSKNLEPNHAFNIIYGAIEYAEDCGFSPAKEFKVTEYLLDDVEEIEFEEIEFGQNGQPLFICGPHDNFEKNIKILNKTVGEGNYKFIGPANDFFDDEEEEEDFDEYSMVNQLKESNPELLNELMEMMKDNNYRMEEDLSEEDILKKAEKIKRKMSKIKQVEYDLFIDICFFCNDYFNENGFDLEDHNLIDSITNSYLIKKDLNIATVRYWVEVGISRQLDWENKNFLVDKQFVESFEKFNLEELQDFPKGQIIDVNDLMYPNRLIANFYIANAVMYISQELFNTMDFESLSPFEKDRLIDKFIEFYNKVDIEFEPDEEEFENAFSAVDDFNIVTYHQPEITIDDIKVKILEYDHLFTTDGQYIL